jgi:foldase protein PrsA
MKNKLTVLFLCVAALFVFTACSSSPVAKVNGVKITQDQYEQYTNYMVAYYEQMYSSYGMEFTMTDDMATSMQSSTIDSLVYMEELKQACADAKCTPTDDEIQSYVYSSLGVTESSEYETALSNIKSSYGMDEKMVVSVISSGLYQEKLEDYLADKQDITYTTAQAKELYTSDPDSYNNRTVSYILIKPDDTDATTDSDGNTVYTDAAWTAAETKAEKVIKKLDDGADFATMAKKYSDDSSTASDGGSISDSFTKSSSSYVEEFTDAAFALT